MRAEDCDPRQRDFLIQPVITDLVDDVDQLADVLEEVSLQELFLARHLLIKYNTVERTRSVSKNRVYTEDGAQVKKALAKRKE